MELLWRLRWLIVSYKELPNVKVGVTNSVHRRLRDLKQKGDNFNDVIDRLLPKEKSKPFDIVESMYKALD